MAKIKANKKSYVCGTDFDYEIGVADDVTLYSSIKALKKGRQCWKECGIVELEIKIKKWVEPQNLFKNINKENKNA